MVLQLPLLTIIGPSVHLQPYFEESTFPGLFADKINCDRKYALYLERSLWIYFKTHWKCLCSG
jgi:hypothetical protein